MSGPSSQSESEALHARACTMVRAFERGVVMPESFDALAIDLVRFQAKTIPGYARLCAARGVDPARLVRAGDAPAVPTDAFKLAHVFAFAGADAAVTFRTSGTTLGARGVHLMRDVGTYDAASLAFGRMMLARELVTPVSVIVIGPSADEAPDSSLAHMCTLFARALAPGPPPATTYFVREGTLDVGGLRARVTALATALFRRLFFS